MLHSYHQLRRRLDRHAESVSARYSEHIACRPGCGACCVSGLTLCAVEAAALGEALGLAPDRVHLQAGQSPLDDLGRCAFIDRDQLCLIYRDRPVICRTQGLPLLYPERGVAVCDLNFVSIDPHHTALIDMENLETALFAANLDYCRKVGLHPTVRVPMDRLARMAGIID